MGQTGRVDGRKVEDGMIGCQCIAREILESEYSWEDIWEREDGGRQRKLEAEK